MKKVTTNFRGLRGLLHLCLLSLSLVGSTHGQTIVIGQSAPLTGVLAETGKDMVLLRSCWKRKAP